ncbi:MAG: type II secretion system F family protein [Microbacteriaceae bacterium]
MKRPQSEYGLALSELTTLFAIALAGGAGHREALVWSANRATNPRLEDYALLATSVDDGMPLNAACRLALADSSEARFQEFVTKLELSAKLGTSLQQQLTNFRNTLRSDYLIEFRSLALKSETRMLFPQVLITLPLSILFALFPSIQMLQGANL